MNRRVLLPVLGVVAGTVLGVAFWDSRAGAPPTGAGPSSAPVTGPGPGTMVGLTTPGTTEPPIVTGDGENAVAMAALFSMLGVQTPDEWAVALSQNVPEDEVAECMRGAGFEYVEGLSPEEEARMDLRGTMPDEEWAERFGLGVTAWELGLLTWRADPNDAQYWSMTRARQDAYNQSLGVCQGRWDTERRAQSDALNVAVDEFRAALDADPRIVAALAEWRACMAAAGYPFDTPQAMRESISLRMKTGISRAELEKLHADEVAVALANLPCEAALHAAKRDVTVERFGEYQTLFDLALARGAAPEAYG